MTKGYLIGHLTVTDPDLYAESLQKEVPVLDRHGARFVVRGGQGAVVEGDAPPAAGAAHHVVLEFPSYAAARAAYDDPEYQAVAEIRRRAADAVFVVVEGAE